MEGYEISSLLKNFLQEHDVLPSQICADCGELNKKGLKIFEGHHPHTSAYSERKRNLCLVCHKIITVTQEQPHPYFRDKQLPIEERLYFILLSHAAEMERMLEIQKRFILLLYEKRLKNESATIKSVYEKRKKETSLAQK